MKKIQLLFSYLFVVIFLSGLFYSCEKNESVEPDKTEEENSDDNNDDSDNTDGVTAQFSPADTQHVVVGGDITFEVEDDSAITSVEWTFEGGSPNESTDKSVTVTYESVENSPFDVTLIVNGENNSDTLTREDLIYVDKQDQGYTREYTDNLTFSNTEKLKLFRSDDVVDSIYNFQVGGDTVFVKPLDSDKMQVNGEYSFSTISQIQKIASQFIFSGDFSTSNLKSSSQSKLVVDPQSGSVSLMSDDEMGFDDSMTEDIDGNLISYNEKLDYTVEGVDENGYIGDEFTFNGITITEDELDKVQMNIFQGHWSRYKFIQLYVNNNMIYGIFECKNDGRVGELNSFALYNISTESKNIEYGGNIEDYYGEEGYYDDPYLYFVQNSEYESDRYDMHTHYIDYQDYSITNIFEGTLKNSTDYKKHYSPYFMYHVKGEKEYYIDGDYGGKFTYDRSGYIMLLDNSTNANHTQINKIVPFGNYVYVITKSNQTSSNQVVKFPVSYFKDLVSDFMNFECYKYLELNNLPSGVFTIMEKEIATTYKQDGMWVIEATDGTMKYIGSDGSVQNANAVESDELSF